MPQQITETVPFNFNELYTGLEQKFVAAGYDVAQGSNVSQLITAMAYFTSMLNVNTAVNINEMLLPTAQQRDNVLTDARALGYEIQHKQSFSYNLTLYLSGNALGDYVIPKHAVFTEGGKKYYYLGDQVNVVGQTQPVSVDVIVHEGELFSHLDYPELQIITTNVINEQGASVPQYFIDIPFQDIEENGIECFTTYYDDIGNLVTDEPWTKTNQLTNDYTNQANTKKEFFRADDIKSLNPRIYFRLNSLGLGLKVGTTVKLNLLKTSGVLGAMTAPNNVGGIQHTIADAVITAVSLAKQGTDEENVQSIKINAPRFFNSANRAVTANDYTAFCNRESSVSDSFVWGGDDEFPKSPGHVWFSFLPSLLTRSYSQNSQNSQFSLIGSFFSGWDYNAVNGTTAYANQLATANSYYSAKFVEDAEIRSNRTPQGQIVQPGIWDNLDKHKIPSIEFHNRHPIYLHFDYAMEILNYNIVTSRADVNQNVFNIIDNVFTGVNDSLKIEQFGVKYFHSSLEKRVDAYLTDASGYNNTVATKMLLTHKNISTENIATEYKDIFIPLSVPFESYFDVNGMLLYDVLPNIDTVDFIDYGNGPIPRMTVKSSLYTDWRDIQTEINNGITQQHRQIITAPIRVSTFEAVTASYTNQNVVPLKHVTLYPDDPSTLTSGVQTYDLCVVTIFRSNGTVEVLPYNTGWTYGIGTDPQTLYLNRLIQPGDYVTVRREAMCGQYVLFNHLKKNITVQLYVNGINYLRSQQPLVGPNDTPKPYLTPNGQLYTHANSSMYVSSSGFALTSNSITGLSGSIVKYVSSEVYKSTPLFADLFDRDRYLNLKYNSPNFEINRNLIPMLNSVTFK